MAYYSATDTLGPANHYVSDTQVSINSTDAPASSATLYVNGDVRVGNADRTDEMDLYVIGKSGSIQMYSTASTTGNKGIWLVNAAGTGAAGIRFNQSNYIDAIADFSTNLLPYDKNLYSLGSHSKIWKNGYL